MNVQERIARLEALLARVTGRAGEPRTIDDGPTNLARVDGPAVANGPPTPGAVAAPPPVVAPPPPVVSVSAIATPEMREEKEEKEEETEELDLDAVQLESVRPPPARPEPPPLLEDPSESRERLVAAPAFDELTDTTHLPPVDDGDGPTLSRRSPADDDAPELEVGASAELEPEAGTEEPPVSSRRPISLEPPEPPLDELAFGDAAPAPTPHTPPPESGRQVALTPADLDFEGEATGVRSKHEESADKLPTLPPAPPAQAAAAHVAEGTSARAKSVPPPSVPPVALVPKVTPQTVQPILETTGVAVAFVGKPVEFRPASFGDLLDASLDL